MVIRSFPIRRRCILQFKIYFSQPLCDCCRGFLGRRSTLCRHRSCPVRAGKINDLLSVCHIIEQIHSCDSVTRTFAILVICIDCVLIDRHCLVINHIMAVALKTDVILSRFENIAAACGLNACIVIRCHIFGCNFDFYCLRSTWLKCRCFGKSAKDYFTLLDSAFCVGCAVIDFYNVLARHVSGIFDCNCCLHSLTVICHIIQSLFKTGVTQTVTERELHCAVIIDEAVSCRCLIETISNIDAFIVLDIVECIIAGFRIACACSEASIVVEYVCVIIGTKAVICGIGFHCICKCIRCFS